MVKFTLVIAALAALASLLVLGIIDAPPLSALPPNAPVPKFLSATITPCQAFQRRPVPESPGRLQTGCTSLPRLIQQAYGLFATGHTNPLSSITVSGGPTWINSALYQINAEAPGQTHAMMNGPMLRALLEDRFQLKVRRETEDVPVYALTASKDTLKRLPPFQGTCMPWDSDDPPNHRDPNQICGTPRNMTGNGFDLNAATMADLCMFLLVTLDRPVIDKTGITGRFVFHLDVPTEDLRHQARGLFALSNPALPPPVSTPAFISAAKDSINRLGLDLEPTTGPKESLVIDSVARLSYDNLDIPLIR